MNINDLAEALTILTKYENPMHYFPMDFDYGMISATFNDTFMEATDVVRLTELGWEVRQKPSSGNKVQDTRDYVINELDKGTYELYLDFSKF